MELSPPSLSRSPVSSPNTCSPQNNLSDYPSPDLLDSHYRITSIYEGVCGGMDPNLDPVTSLPALDTMTSADWPGTTSAGLPNVMSVDYDAFANYEQSIPAYGHDMYSAHGQQSPQLLHRTLSRTSVTSSRPSPMPRIKMEGEYTEVSDYPSPRSAQALPIEVGNYNSHPGSSGYLSDPASNWLKSEYNNHAESDQLHSSSQGLVPSDQPRQYRPPRAIRRHPRRLTTKDEAVFHCRVEGCGKMFSRSYNYKAHMETHDENREYPFPCPVSDCSKRFVRKTDLARHHQSVHMKKKNHRCDYCGRMFARKDTLRRHMEDGCPKRFDIGTLDLRQEGYNSPHRGQLAPLAQLPPIQPGSPNQNLLAPVPSLARRQFGD
ncbi:uncharacterized protein BCR38DRAFT_485393 [Pseudomassariella vexata]|uniref:C2H2-type domain-containing protein n=1 Tax=Pseudomassariella vexata TaxID=1141098 RepID=A0A1Y2E057_9PEZI|nr:uncharacterized protein BCR38DRAFT_485393 [Pseudomassariella vexata]ORY64255.1 hypothetical protein BCR38DRAFT_485393 [Pseudomassariella vexata]